MKIILDTLGLDDGLSVAVEGAIRAMEKIDFVPVFAGNKEEIEKTIDNRIEDYEILDSKEIISNDEDPVRAIRRKKESSLVLAYNKLKEEGYNGLVSAGSTGAILAGGLFISGRIKGVNRACIAAGLPTEKGATLLMDSGANMDCKAIFFKEFAIMGSVYLKNVLKIDNPKVALLNIGIEEHKGNKLAKETYALLKETNLNFVGNIEARDLFTGDVNVIVADGFDGNIALKSAEGVISLFKREIKNTIYSSFKTKIAGALLNKDLKKNLSKYSADKVGGAPLLGIKDYVYKAHGNSNPEAFSSAIIGLVDYIRTDTIKKIEGEFEWL